MRRTGKQEKWLCLNCGILTLICWVSTCFEVFLVHDFQKSALWSCAHVISGYSRYVLKLISFQTSFAQTVEREEKQWKCKCVLMEESLLLVQGKRTASSRGCWLLWIAGMSPEQHRLNGFLPTKKETSVLMRISSLCQGVKAKTVLGVSASSSCTHESPSAYQDFMDWQFSFLVCW